MHLMHPSGCASRVGHFQIYTKFPLNKVNRFPERRLPTAGVLVLRKEPAAIPAISSGLLTVISSRHKESYFYAKAVPFVIQDGLWCASREIVEA